MKITGTFSESLLSPRCCNFISINLTNPHKNLEQKHIAILCSTWIQIRKSIPRTQVLSTITKLSLYSYAVEIITTPILKMRKLKP